MNYSEIVKVAEYDEQRPEYRGAIGRGSADEDYSPVEHPVKPEGMPDADWNEYQAWVAEQGAALVYRRVLNARTLEIAGAFDPREASV